MRIIGGKFKGRKLETPEFDGVRPTSDMVRESVFNIAQAYILGADFLDMFAGCGAVGLEALSRGAQSVTFCDRDRRSVALVKKNIDKLDVSECARVLYADWRHAVSLLAGHRFDIVFLDPPYDFLELGDLLSELSASGALAEGAKIIYEFSERNGLPKMDNGFTIDRVRRYGKTCVAVIEVES